MIFCISVILVILLLVIPNVTSKSSLGKVKSFDGPVDVVNSQIIVLELDDAVFDRMKKMQHEKEVRWLSRLEAKEQSDE